LIDNQSQRIASFECMKSRHSLTLANKPVINSKVHCIVHAVKSIT